MTQTTLPPQGGRRAPSEPAEPAGSAGSEAAPTDGRSTRWEDHRAARRQDLAHEARRAVHRLGPELSMDDIATELGTSKSILYRYFTDKGGLQHAVGQTVVRAIHEALTAASAEADSPRTGLQNMIEAYLGMIEHSPNVYYFVTRHAPLANSVAPPGTGQVAQSAPLSEFLHSVVALVATSLSRDVGLSAEPDVAPGAEREADSDRAAQHAAAIARMNAWSVGAVGFVTGTGEWWLTNRGEPGVPDLADIAHQITSWLWHGAGIAGRTSEAESHV